MSLEMFQELTNAQLKEECEDLKVTVEPVGTKATKKDYLDALEKHFGYEPAVVEPVEEKEEVKAEAAIQTTRKPQSKSKLARLEMFRKDRVVIHDIQENQSKDKDEMLPVSWGNRMLGGQTDFVSLNGQPQYVRRGAINNMLEATTVIHKQKANNNGVTSEVVKRFVITEVDGFTPEELEELATKQRMRNSKYA